FCRNLLIRDNGVKSNTQVVSERPVTVSDRSAQTESSSPRKRRRENNSSSSHAYKDKMKKKSVKAKPSDSPITVIPREQHPISRKDISDN
ncbi:polynucleotide adenylyltransferase, partial [Xenorhabdus bovienii]|nr:polynucleotide adenylyltransferase [Xenorhabdus bovienii]